MPRAHRPLLLTAAALLAVFPGHAPAASEEAPLIGSASGVTFSGADKAKGSDGRRLWTLSAESAAPLDAPGAKPKDLRLKSVRIRTFDRKGGAVQFTITAPVADYLDTSKTARNTGSVSVEAPGVRLSGRDWSWENASGRDTIKLGADVAVHIAGKGKGAPVSIFSRALRAVQVEKEGLRLEFEGDVRVVREDTVVSCERLTTHVRGDLEGGAEGRSAKDAVERIDATGGVRVSHKDSLITGRSAEIFPSRALYSVIGDARFQETGDRRVLVKGEAMRYDQANQRVTVEPRADSPDGRVEAELAPIQSKEADALARASGRQMEIRMKPEGNTLELSGEVRLDDPDYTGTCDTLTVHTRPRPQSPDAKPVDMIVVGVKPSDPSLVVAEGDVTLTRKPRGTTVRCGKAEFLPMDNRVNLSLTPRAEDLRTGAAIEAHTMTMGTKRKEEYLRATGAPDGSKPVHLVLPPVSLLAKDRKNTWVEAGVLEFSHPPKEEDVSLFEFDGGVKIAGDGIRGTCRRLAIEVEPVPTAAPRPAKSDWFSDSRTRHRLRRLFAVGDAHLELDKYAAQAGRAEIIPNARLKEFSVADDNGMDGREPLFIQLTAEESLSPGLRTKVTHPPMPLPKIGDQGFVPSSETASASARPGSPMTLEADSQDLFLGANRLRAFASGKVELRGEGFSCDAGNAELLATRDAATRAFAADTLVARGGVRAKFEERSASADTLEIFPRLKRIALSGSPVLDGWASPPGVQRKTLTWKTTPASPGKPATTELIIRDEGRAGVAEGVMRPKIYLPKESSPNLGRALKILDKAD